MTASFEYVDDLRQIEMISTNEIELTSPTFSEFLRTLDFVNEGEPLASTELSAAPSSNFDYVVTTKAGPKLTYLLVPVGSEIHFSITTEGTVWVPERLLRNTALRRQLVLLIQLFGLQTMEILYF